MARHPRIVPVLEVLTDPETREVVLVMEYQARGVIFKKESRGHGMPLPKVHRAAKDLITSLQVGSSLVAAPATHQTPASPRRAPHVRTLTLARTH